MSTVLSVDTSTASVPAQSEGRKRRVSFAEHANLILDDDERGGFTKGPFRLSTRTLSVGAPSLSMNWSGFKNSLSDAFAPLLSPTSAGNGGVCSISSMPPSGSMATSPKSDPGSGAGSYFPAYGSRSYWKKQMELGDESYIPNQPKRLEVRLPSLTRKRVRSRSRSSEPSKGILVSTSPTASTSRDRDKDAAISPSSASATSPTTPSTTTTALPEEERIKSEPVPLRPCCKACRRGCDYALREDYVEYWSPSAKRKRAEEASRSAPSAGVEPAPIGTNGADDDDEEVPLHTGAMASHTAPIMVDELKCKQVSPLLGGWDQEVHESIAELHEEEEETSDRPRVDSPTPSERERADTLPPQLPPTTQYHHQQRRATVPNGDGALLGRRRSNAETTTAAASSASAPRTGTATGWASKLGGFGGSMDGAVSVHRLG